MKRWQGSCIGAFVVLLIGGGSLIFFVPFGGAMIAGCHLYLTNSQRMYFARTPQIIRIAILAVHPLTQPTPVAGQVTSLS